MSSFSTVKDSCNEDGVCRLTRRLKYHREESCQAKLTCAGLTGNPCGDYGVAVAVIDPTDDQARFDFDLRENMI